MNFVDIYHENVETPEQTCLKSIVCVGGGGGGIMKYHYSWTISVLIKKNFLIGKTFEDKVGWVAVLGLTAL